MSATQAQLTMDPLATATEKPRTRAPGAKRGGIARSTALPKTELDLLAEISTKLDRVVAVLATHGKDRDTQVAILAAARCDSSFIGMVVGLTPGAVRNLPGWRRGQVDVAAGVSEGSQ